MMRTWVAAFAVAVPLLPCATAFGFDLATEAALDANATGAPDFAVERRIEFEVHPEATPDPATDGPTVDARSEGTPASTPASGPALTAGIVTVGAIAVAGGLYHFGTWRWGLAALLPLFSRIQGDRVLENDVRQRVHQLVAENPGITLKEVASSLGIGWGTAVHHLTRLEQERLLVSERSRQFRRFYKNGGGIVNDQKAAFGELRHPTSQRIARTIAEQPGRCQKEVCEAVGISAPRAHKYLGRLHEVGLIASERQWKSVKYFPTPRLQELLAAGAAAPTPAAA